jgi:uncharacterized protein (TIGR02594 family)
MFSFLSWLGGLIMPAAKQNAAIKAAYPETTGSAAVGRSQATTPFELASTYLHTRETPGKASNPVVLGWLRRIWKDTPGDDTPWCSAFVNAMAAATGYEESRSLAARSWLKTGTALTQREVRRGDIVVLWRGSRDAATGHVAFFDKVDEQRGLIFLLGGNQGDEVNISSYPLSRVLAYRRLRRIKNV